MGNGLSVLVACECSQVVTSAFLNVGCDAFSCDLQPCFGDYPGRHIQDDALKVLYSRSWDLVIAHPPCTFLTISSSCRMFHGGEIDPYRYSSMLAARDFFLAFWDYPGRICIENPKPLKICRLPSPSQHIEPYYFGDPYSKFTYLWLKGLPGLMATLICEEFLPWVGGHSSSGAADRLSIGNRQFRRSRFFPGVAQAMAAQWSSFLLSL